MAHMGVVLLGVLMARTTTLAMLLRILLGPGRLFRWANGCPALDTGPQDLAHKVAGALQDRVAIHVADRARDVASLLVERRVDLLGVPQYKLQSLPRPTPYLPHHVAWSPFCRREVPLRRQAASLLYGTHNMRPVLFRHRQKARGLVAMGATRRLLGKTLPLLYCRNYFAAPALGQFGCLVVFLRAGIEVPWETVPCAGDPKTHRARALFKNRGKRHSLPADGAGDKVR